MYFFVLGLILSDLGTSPSGKFSFFLQMSYDLCQHFAGLGSYVSKSNWDRSFNKNISQNNLAFDKD